MTDRKTLIINFFLILGILISVNFIVDRHYYRWDLTLWKDNTLDKETIKVLRGVKDKIEIYAFPARDDIERYRALLETYKYYCPKIEYFVIDASRQPLKAKKYGVDSFGEVVVIQGKSRVKIDYLDEESLTNAIIKVQSRREKVIYFLAGHGEPGLDDPDDQGISAFRDALKDKGFEPKELNLLLKGKVPPDASCVVIIAPKREPLPVELNALKDYFLNGGRILLALEYDSLRTWKKWSLDLFEIFVYDGVVIDPLAKAFGSNALTPVVIKYPDNDVLSEFNLATFFPIATALRKEKGKLKGVALLKTGSTSWLEMGIMSKTKAIKFDKGVDIKGPLTISYLIRSESKGGEAIVVGDSDFLRNAYFRISGNGDLAEKFVFYLSKERKLVELPISKGKYTLFIIPSWLGRLNFWLSLVGIPGALFLLGGIAWIRRRRL